MDVFLEMITQPFLGFDGIVPDSSNRATVSKKTSTAPYHIVTKQCQNYHIPNPSNIVLTQTYSTYAFVYNSIIFHQKNAQYITNQS